MRTPSVVLTHLATISCRWGSPTETDVFYVAGVCEMIDVSQSLAPFVNDERLRLELRCRQWFVVGLPSIAIPNQPVRILWYLAVSHPSRSQTRAYVWTDDVDVVVLTVLSLEIVHFQRLIAVFVNDVYVCDWNVNRWSSVSQLMLIDVLEPVAAWWQ